jgi:hypothetical protein
MGDLGYMKVYKLFIKITKLKVNLQKRVRTVAVLESVVNAMKSSNRPWRPIGL